MPPTAALDMPPRRHPAFSDRLNEALVDLMERGVTSKPELWLAAKLESDVGTVKRWARGEFEPRLHQVADIATALNVWQCWLLGDTDEKRPNLRAVENPGAEIEAVARESQRRTQRDVSRDS